MLSIVKLGLGFFRSWLRQFYPIFSQNLIDNSGNQLTHLVNLLDISPIHLSTVVGYDNQSIGNLLSKLAVFYLMVNFPPR